MPKLQINGKDVTVGDEFLQLSSDDQNAAVDEIAKSLGTGAQPQGDSRGAIDKLFGIGGPRYQLWPERMARSVLGTVEQGGEMVKKAETGQYGLPGTREFTENAIPDVTDVAFLGVTGAPGAAAELAGSKLLRPAVERPSVEQIKKGSQAAYKMVEDARLIAHEGAVNNLVSATRAGLDQRLITDTVAPRVYKALDQLQNSGGDIAQIMGVRQRLGEILPSEGTDYAAAQHVRDAIDHFIDTLPETEVVSGGDPKFTRDLLQQARAGWRAYAKIDQVQSALQIGEHKAAVSGVGANTQNAMRQRIRQILDSESNSRGYSPEAKKQLEDIVMGTWLTNFARKIGKFAPSSPVSAMTTMGAALGGDLAGGSGMASLAAAGVAIPATIAKYLGTYLTKRQIERLIEILKDESPLGRAALKEANKPRAVPAVATGVTKSIPLAASSNISQMVSPDSQTPLGP